MSYQRVSARDDTEEEHHDYSRQNSIPNSPPPSFRSRTSSIAPHERQRLVNNHDIDRNLADAFDSPSDDENDEEEHLHTSGSRSPLASPSQLDDRQRAMSGRPADMEDNTSSNNSRPAQVERRVTQLPIFAPATSGRVYGGGNAVHDGVFANLSAKIGPGEDAEEKPPTYEQAAADATPPYWETHIMAPGGMSSDDVFIDGLAVGSLFSFIWNGMISMSFQLVGFLLTYLLHTTHAAKNGSKAGLGLTLIQYGFSLKSTGFSGDQQSPDPTLPGQNPGGIMAPPGDPNNHDFDPNAPIDGGNLDGGAGPGVGGMKTTDWFAYALMIVGWFLLIRSIGEYLKARRHEQLVLQSPSRGLSTPVVAENEHPESSV